MPAVGRNDPCPCGSGKKYKHCCGRAARVAAPPAVVVPHDGPLPSRRSLERDLADVVHALAAREFATQDEMDAYVNEHLNQGPLPHYEPASALEGAQDIMYDAWDAVGRQRVRLARRALRISPDCADAYALLAEDAARSPRAALDLYTRGVEAAARALGPDIFDQEVGNFWGILETRPYMRARLGLGSALVDLGRHEEANAQFPDLLRLNPGDNQGVRYLLLASLLAIRDWTGAEALLDRYAGDTTAAWPYSRALIAFARGGDTAAARPELAAAMGRNSYVPAYLLGQRRLPAEFPDAVGYGDTSEAV